MTKTSKTIFISYRRNDNVDFVERIRDWFIREYGRDNVFLDFDSIPPFAKFEDFIRDKIEACDMLVAIIGPKWLKTLKEKAGNFETDYMRIEIALAFQLGKPVAPICIKNAKLPRSDQIPEDLRPLLQLHTPVLNSGTQFYDTIEQILSSVEKEFKSKHLNPIRAQAEELIQSGHRKREKENAFEEALKDYYKAIQIDPNYAEAYFWKAETKLSIFNHWLNQSTDRKLDDAVRMLNQIISTYSKAIKLARGDNELIYNATIKEVQTYEVLSGLYKVTKNPLKALLGYQLSIDIRESYLKQNSSQLSEENVKFLHRQAADIYSKTADIYIEIEKIEEAIANYKKAIELNSQNSDYYFNLSELLRKMDKLEEAAEVFEIGAKISPAQAADYLESTAHQREKRRDYNKAIELYTEALKYQPHNPQLFFLRGAAKRRNHQNIDAICDFDKAIEFDIDNYYSYLLRAYCKQAVSDIKGAIEDLEFALSIANDDIDDSSVESVQDRIIELKGIMNS